MDKVKLFRYAERLTSPYRETLELYYSEGLTQKEVAERMQVSLYKAKGNLSKALYLVRKEAKDIELKKAELILAQGK